MNRKTHNEILQVFSFGNLDSFGDRYLLCWFGELRGKLGGKIKFPASPKI
jgi:hypothetical protein